MKLLRLMVKWGFPTPQRQHPILDRTGRFVAKVDLAVPAWKLVLEYDGQEFHGPRRKHLDAARQARIEALGWTVIRVTGGICATRPPSELVSRPSPMRQRPEVGALLLLTASQLLPPRDGVVTSCAVGETEGHG